MDRWGEIDNSETPPAEPATETVAVSLGDSLGVSLGDVESQLGQLLDELRGLQLERHAAKAVPSNSEQLNKIEWDSSLENFLLKATVIRRMLSQFRGSDLSTRRYLRHQLDEEFENLKSVYGSLSEQFTTN